MIIDIHAHLAYAPLYPEHFLSNMFIGLNSNEKSRLNKLLPLFLKDKDCTAFIKQMDSAGIDKAVLLIIDGGIALGEAQMSINEIFSLHYTILKKHPDRFLVFGGVDPRRGKTGFDLFRKGIEEYLFKGLKLYPPMGVHLEDDILTPYFEYCQQNQLPVLLHTGPSQENLKNELANPIYIKPVAKRFPGINFILAHSGFNLTEELMTLVEKSDNIYLDIAGFHSKYSQLDDACIKNFDIILNNPNLNIKVLFGTDWPLFNFMQPVSKQIDALKEISKAVCCVTENGLENILYKNAQRILQ